MVSQRDRKIQGRFLRRLSAALRTLIERSSCRPVVGGKETGGPSQSRPLVFARQGRFNLTYDLTL